MKAHCIGCPIKILPFCRLLLFFQNQARIADSSDNEFIIKSVHFGHVHVCTGKYFLFVTTQ